MEEQDIHLILEMLKEMKANQAKVMAKLDAYQAKTEAGLLAMQVMETSHKGIVAETKPETEIKTMACQEMEARQEEKKPTSPDRKPKAAQKEEVPAKNAEVIPVGEPRKKRRRTETSEIRRNGPREKMGAKEDWPPPTEE
jgi:hypothetical protein